jgi:hypothetical protein
VPSSVANCDDSWCNVITSVSRVTVNFARGLYCIVGCVPPLNLVSLYLAEIGYNTASLLARIVFSSFVVIVVHQIVLSCSR